MELILLIVHVVEIIIFVYLAASALYIFIFALAGLLFPPKKQIKLNENNLRKIAVLIPGYKEDNVICDVANEALNQDYPKDLFDVVIIADSFKETTLSKLRELPIKLIEVSFEISTKSKALNKAMEVLGDEYEIALVLDADNVMEHDFLSRINQSFNNDFEVVQGHRIAKNTNTALAVLDAISEEINNHIFRKGHRSLGFSSALIGSGMAFSYRMFKERMQQIKAVGGFDKELELTLLRDGYKIEYLADALVLDEKVQKHDVFENQRKRWLSAQFIYFGRFFFPGFKHLFLKGNFDFFDKVSQMISPPRVLLLGISGIIAFLITIFELVFPTNEIIFVHSPLWLLNFLIVVMAFIFSIPTKFYNKQTLNALMTLPKTFFLMFGSLFKLKGANKKFIHTEHGNL